jgi:DNA polymerase (family X)
LTVLLVPLAREGHKVEELTNNQLADMLERIADLLEAQDSHNPFRLRAYRQAAETIRHHEKPLASLVHGKQSDELKALPNIGSGIAAVISEYVSSGKSSLLDDLEAKNSPETEIMRIPGIGRELAQRVVDSIHIQTLPELEEAAHDGRLELVEGFGPRRIEAIRTALAAILGHSTLSKQRERLESAKTKNSKERTRPDVALLLAIDAEYRQRANAGELHKIAPRRFNPDNVAWLPVLHTKRDGWNFTVMYSNTAQAHQLQRTDDWVVIYFERDDKEQQCTVVTETKGELKGKRVVRGLHEENKQYYRSPIKK